MRRAPYGSSIMHASNQIVLTDRTVLRGQEVIATSNSTTKITHSVGGGQWGKVLILACRVFPYGCRVFPYGIYRRTEVIAFTSALLRAKLPTSREQGIDSRVPADRRNSHSPLHYQSTRSFGKESQAAPRGGEAALHVPDGDYGNKIQKCAWLRVPLD